MQRLIAFVLATTLLGTGCTRPIVVDRQMDYLAEVRAACPQDQFVFDADGKARARDVNVRDVSAGEGPWLEVCGLDAAQPAVWTADRRPIGVEEAVLEFRKDDSGATLALTVGTAAAVLVAFIIIVPTVFIANL